MEIQADHGVEEADALQKDLSLELHAGLRDWHPEQVVAGSPRTEGTPRLQVRIRRFDRAPAGSPFASIGLPGALGVGSGAILMHQGSMLASDVGPSLLWGAGFGLGLMGLAALVVGIVLESRKAVLDRQRGYPLRVFRAEARLIRNIQGSDQVEKETYRAYNLGSYARPLRPPASADPATVRREMMRALALSLRTDFGRKTGWSEPPED